MKAKGYLLSLAVTAGLTIFTLTSSQVLAADDEWTDYDPCGWNVEEEVLPQELTLAEINEDKWTDYDPCGWNAEQEVLPQELTLADGQWNRRLLEKNSQQPINPDLLAKIIT